MIVLRSDSGETHVRRHATWGMYDYIIEKGRTVWSGSSSDLAANAELVHRYVGV